MARNLNLKIIISNFILTLKDTERWNSIQLNIVERCIFKAAVKLNRVLQSLIEARLSPQAECISSGVYFFVQRLIFYN